MPVPAPSAAVLPATCALPEDPARRRWLRAALAAGAGLSTGLGVGEAHAADPGVLPDQVRIGQTLTLQGGRNAYGVAVTQGIGLMFNEVNRSGGVHGRRLVLQTLDDENRNATAEANARQLAQAGAFLLFAPIEGGPSGAVAKVAQELQVPLFGPMAGPPTLRRPHQSMVYPVRAEHREEFRALLVWGRGIGLRRVGFFHVDSDGGRAHLANVQAIANELGMEVTLPLAFAPEIDDAALAAMGRRVADSRVEMVLNHGSVGLYRKLIVAAREAGSRATLMGVNSGSSQLVAALGPLAQGMLFSQVVPSPWERKHAISREYQDAAKAADPRAEFSYGALEGYMTAKALVLALRACGRDLSRAALHRALRGHQFDLGGLKTHYAEGDHAGAHFVDLSMVSRDGRFIH